jgi:hypothetical protein
MVLTSISWTDPKTLAVVAVIVVAIAVVGYMVYAWQTKHWPFS